MIKLQLLQNVSNKTMREMAGEPLRHDAGRVAAILNGCDGVKPVSGCELVGSSYSYFKLALPLCLGQTTVIDRDDQSISFPTKSTMYYIF